MNFLYPKDIKFGIYMEVYVRTYTEILIYITLIICNKTYTPIIDRKPPKNSTVIKLFVSIMISIDEYFSFFQFFVLTV